MDEFKFFISRSQVFGYTTVIGFLDSLFILALIGVILEKLIIAIIIMSAGIIFMNLILIYALIPYMRKVILSYEGIEIKKPKGQKKFVKWEEFETVYISIVRNIRYVTFEIKTDNQLIERKEKVLEFEVDKKRLAILKKLCTNQKILSKLNNMKLSYFIFNQKHGPM